MPSPVEPNHEHGDDPVTRPPDLHYPVIPAQAERLSAARRVLTRWAESIGMLAEQVQALTLATYEAMANVVGHAYRGQPQGVVELHANYHVRDRQVMITVVDHGRWQLAAVACAGGRSRPGGRGLSLINALADAVTIRSDADGTTVCMSWYTAKPAH